MSTPDNTVAANPLLALPITFNAISLVVGLCVAVSFLCMAYYRPDLADRISLRLVFLANAASFSYSIWIIAELGSGSTSRAFCISATLFIIISDTVAAISVMLVGVNLFILVVVSNSKYTPHERIYFITICGLSFINGLVVFLYSMISPHPIQKEGYSETCWYANHDNLKHDRAFIFKYYSYFRGIVFILCVVLFLSIIVALKVKKDWFKNIIFSSYSKPRTQVDNQVEKSASSEQELISKDTQYEKMYHRIAIRCLFYMIALLITRVFDIVFIVKTRHFKDPDLGYLIANYTVSGTEGIFLGLIFFSDPAVVASAKDLVHYWRSSRSIHSLDPEIGVENL